VGLQIVIRQSEPNLEYIMRHYETIHTEDTQGFHIVCSVTPEDVHPRDLFDYEEEELQELCRKIDDGIYVYFAVRVDAYKNGILLGSDFLGACLYESYSGFIEESGYYSDMVDNAVKEAKDALEMLYATREPLTA
jgi:hypothetical protein